MNRPYAPPLPYTHWVGLPTEYLARRRRLHALRAPLPRFLYRYTSANPDSEQSVDRLRDVIVRSDLWLSAAADFNDPFDLSARFVMTDDRKLMRAWMHEMVQRQYPGIKWTKRNELINKTMGDRGLLDAKIRRAFRGMLDQIGVSCFTSDPRNLLMWSHYSAGHTGVALQFEPARTRDALLYVIPVEYRTEDDYPTVTWPITDRDRIVAALRRKHHGWSYEREIRLIHLDAAHSYIRIEPEALTGIIIGCRASAATERALEQLLTERRQAGHPTPSIYRAIQHEGSYRVVIRRISMAADGVLEAQTPRSEPPSMARTTAPRLFEHGPR